MAKLFPIEHANCELELCATVTIFDVRVYRIWLAHAELIAHKISVHNVRGIGLNVAPSHIHPQKKHVHWARRTCSRAHVVHRCMCNKQQICTTISNSLNISATALSVLF